MPGEFDMFLAEWVLGRVTPEGVVQRAVRALEGGCEHQSVAVLARSRATTRGEIDAELPRLLSALDRELPTAEEALKVLVDHCASQIVRDQVDPMLGAELMFDLWITEHESVDLLSQIRPFVDLAYDEDLYIEPPGTRAGAIRTEAVAFLERGGLQLPL